MINHSVHLAKGLGSPSKGRLSRWRNAAHRILKRSNDYRNLSDEELLNQGKDVRWRAKTGLPLHTLLEETFALGIEASRRTTGMEHYPVQIMGGMAIFEGGIAELQTGEGKTLTATLPSLLRVRAAAVVGPRAPARASLNREESTGPATGRASASTR